MARAHIPVSVERTVVERAQDQCEYCRCLRRFHSDPFAIEHIIPVAHGGDSTPENLASSCLGCNSFKGAATSAVDPVLERDVPLFHPRRQRWSDHFMWNHDTTRIIGITATGRATAIKLRLNRPGLVNLREALGLFGVHPPEDISEPDPADTNSS